MKYTFVLFGRLKEKYLKDALDDYIKRINPFALTEVIYLEETAYKKEPSLATISMSLDAEADKILKRLSNKDKLILADLHGKEVSSEQFAQIICNMKNQGGSDFYIVIGSSYGLSDKLRKRADFAIKLSSLTFTHPFVLVLMAEQIYRAEMILGHQTYHK